LGIRHAYCLPMTSETYRAAQARRLPAGPVAPFTLRALAGILPAGARTVR
jgi:hypothetical protein